jgi:hypothetical protein
MEKCALPASGKMAKLARKAMADETRTVSEGAALDEFLDELQRQHEVREIAGWDTGFAALNGALDGILPGLYLIVGQPACGKTAFAKQLLDQVAMLNDALAIFFSFAESKNELSSLVHKFGNVFVLSRQTKRISLSVELSHHCLEVIPREFPLKWRSDIFIVLLEGEESVFDFLKRVEVVGRERLTFNDGEVDFDLIEPTCVDRSMHGDEVGESCFEAPNTGLAAVRRAVVHDPEHAPSVAIRWLRHDLSH